MSDQFAVDVEIRAAPASIAADPLMRRIKDELSTIYGSRLRGVILYGSRARGDNRPDSDVDILVLIREFDRSRDWNDKLHRLSDDVFEETGLELNVFPKDEQELSRRTIFMHNVREEGLRL